MGVAGGALFPPLQGLWADAQNTEISCKLFFSTHTILRICLSDQAPFGPADIINAVGFAVVIAYGVGMFFYDRRMKKKMADAALFANANALPAVGSSLDEKDSASVDKLEVHDAQYENVVRA